MFDNLEEKHAVIEKSGSFWSKTLEDSATYTPHKLTHISFLNRAIDKLKNIIHIALGTDKIDVNDLTIRFGDKHISGNTLLVDKNLLVTSIYYKDTALVRNIDFYSGYGFIRFDKDPIGLFPKMRFLMRSGILRVPNIWCYLLGLQDTYGTLNEVVQYYRNNQSVNQFYKAAAQAAGLLVVQLDSLVDSVIELDDNYIVYVTDTNDRYDVTYTHQKLLPGNKLKAGEVIGKEYFYIIDDKKNLGDITGALTSYSTPVPNLFIPNKENVILYRNGKFKPDYLGDLEAYWRYLESIGAAPLPVTQSDSGNPLEHFRNSIAPGRTLIIYIDRNFDTDTKNRLIGFITINAPIGSVILWALKN